jgi:hypothetical protein
MDKQYLSPKEVADQIPGMTTSLLATLRFNKKGPRYLKPTERKVLYRPSDIQEWLDASVRETAQEAS